jgi:quercetin dioxygenase-like cupin family protein
MGEQIIDLNVSNVRASAAVQEAVNMKPTEAIAYDRGRNSLDRSVWYNGTLMTFLATGEDTQGQFALIESVARKGNAPPPHIHHQEDETFYILEGELAVTVGDRTIEAGPGTLVFLPRNVQHSFTIESEQIRMLVLLAPAGLEGWFKELSVPAQAMEMPPAGEIPFKEIQRMLEIAPRYGLEFIVPKSQ